MADNNPKIIPPVECTNNPQVEDIRIMMMDAAPDNYSVVTNDYFFSDAEIMSAMRRCIEAYNDIPPLSIRLVPGKIYSSYWFKAGTCWQLCLSKLLYYQRKSTDYTTGGVSTNIYKPIIESLLHHRDSFKVEFESLARAQKEYVNIRAGFGPVG